MEIWIVLSGSGTLHADGRQYVYQAGDMLSLPEGMLYRLEVETEGSFGRVEIEDFFNSNPKAQFSPAANSTYALRIFLLAMELKCAHFRNEQQVFKAVETLFAELFVEANLQSAPPSPLVMQMVEHMLENIANPYYDLTEEIAMTNYHPDYLRQRFRKEVGLTPKEFLLRQRIDRAKELLTRTDHSVGEVAAQCGFLDASYFTRQFRKHEGVSPTDYRLTAKETTTSGMS